MDQQKVFFTIQQLSEKLKIPKPTLRFWEKELKGIIVPLRTRGGQRRYTIKHCLIISEIKRLKGKGMNLSEIKSELKKNTSKCHSTQKEVDQLAERLAELVKVEVYNFFK